MERPDVIERLWRASPLFMPLEQFAQGLANSSVEAVEEDGRVIGAFVVTGPEIHFQKFDHTRVCKRHFARLARVIAEHGYAETRTPAEDVRQRRLNARLGFFEVGEDGGFIRMRIERLRERN